MPNHRASRKPLSFEKRLFIYIHVRTTPSIAAWKGCRSRQAAISEANVV